MLNIYNNVNFKHNFKHNFKFQLDNFVNWTPSKLGTLKFVSVKSQCIYIEKNYHE